MKEIIMKNEEKIKQAEYFGNFEHCPNCKQLQPTELTFFNPDEDTKDLIACLVCGEAIRFI